MVAIRLKILGEEYLEHLHALASDPTVREYTRIPEPPPDGFARAWLRMYEAARLAGTRELFGVTDEDDGEFYGMAAAVSIDLDAATAELGYMLLPSARGRGIATAALAELTRWAFDELRMHRLELMIVVANGPSRAVAERCGYLHEGTHRSLFLKNGADGPIRHDTEVWAKLVTDPRG